MSATPPPPENPRPVSVQEIADQSGWDHIVTQRLSPGRSGMMFRKRVLTDRELVPVVTDLIANIERINTIEQRLGLVEDRLSREGIDRRSSAPVVEGGDPRRVEVERKRAEKAELALDRLRNRRSVRMALALARPTQGIFRVVRSWKKSR